MPLFHMKTIMNALCQGSAGSHKPQAPLSAPLIHFPTLPPTHPAPLSSQPGPQISKQPWRDRATEHPAHSVGPCSGLGLLCSRALPWPHAHFFAEERLSKELNLLMIS